MSRMRQPVELDATEIVRVLNAHGVRYVIVGGFAALLHGLTQTTFDIDITPQDSEANLERLCAALDALDAQLWPPGADLPVDWPWTPRGFRDLTTAATRTRAGDLDIVLRPDAPGGRTFRYEELASDAVVIALPDVDAPVAALEHVIASKEAAGRDKDRLALPLLRALLDLHRSQRDPGGAGRP